MQIYTHTIVYLNSIISIISENKMKGKKFEIEICMVKIFLSGAVYKCVLVILKKENNVLNGFELKAIIYIFRYWF